MSQGKKKVVAIVGPTASGKSDLAVELALVINGQVISADARQVYRGLDIGTGKISKKEMKGVPHFLIDITSPKRQFTVSNYIKLAKKCIENISLENSVPIICGGTGFYLSALLDNVSVPEVPPNPSLRNRLMKLTAEKLFKMLLKKDKRRAKSIDKQNKQRLIRALEIVAALGKVPKIQKNKEEKNYEVFWLGLKPNKETLKTKIKRRLNLRLKKGMIIEARKLHKIGLSWKRMEELGLEYRYLALYLQKKISKQEMINKLETKIWQYAKRQMTWFKRNKKIFWIDPDNQAQKKIAFKIIKSWLNK